jgi:hypothetical protein
VGEGMFVVAKVTFDSEGRVIASGLGNEREWPHEVQYRVIETGLVSVLVPSVTLADSA